MEAITRTNFNFPGQTGFYQGKVRDVYTINNHIMLMVATDRISAFDVVLPKGIPYKGQVLNQIAARFLDATADIVPNWKIATPDPMVTAGFFCTPFRVEMVVRRYLTGHIWREYKKGNRAICGIKLPNGMKENDRFTNPVITPTTKAMAGHDLDISRQEIVSRGLVSPSDYVKLEEYSLALFERGSQIAEKMGLILVDTKYEFGNKNGKIYLIDEIHTPDSSRYFYKDGYEARQDKGLPQKQLSKEFVRQWLIERNFSGQTGQQIPHIPQEFVLQVSDRYIELYENITGEKFCKQLAENPLKRIELNCLDFLKQQNSMYYS